MTSSSSRTRRAATGPASTARPAKWAWQDLRETGPEADAARRAADVQRTEVERAYQRGYRDGEEAGASAARNELRIAMSATLEALEEIRVSREAWEARLQERLVVLAAAMAQKVFEHTRHEDPQVFVDLARRAVAAFPVEEAIRIRLHPTDRAVLEKGGFLESVVGARSVRWVPDEQVVPGGCIVEGPDKIVDGRVDEALARIVWGLTHG